MMDLPLWYLLAGCITSWLHHFLAVVQVYEQMFGNRMSNCIPDLMVHELNGVSLGLDHDKLEECSRAHKERRLVVVYAFVWNCESS